VLESLADHGCVTSVLVWYTYPGEYSSLHHKVCDSFGCKWVELDEKSHSGLFLAMYCDNLRFSWIKQSCCRCLGDTVVGISGTLLSVSRTHCCLCLVHTVVCVYDPLLSVSRTHCCLCRRPTVVCAYDPLLSVSRTHCDNLRFSWIKQSLCICAANKR
jgi:hypothetical protein